MIPLSRPLLGHAEQEAVSRVLASGRLVSGPEVEAFESEFADFVGTRHAVATSNGTSALYVGLIAAGIGRGDEVILPSFTFIATANAVVATGATPVFADIDEASFCIDISDVERKITSRTAAVIAVHLYGHPAANDRLTTVCQGHGLVLIEDAAQAHGASWRGKPVGAWGLFGTFSFYPTKNMTTGEGGMITTDDAGLARSARLARNHGMSTRYVHEVFGMNERMTEMAAAIGRVQLTRLPDWLEARQGNAQRYDRDLADVLPTPQVAEGAVHAYHQYTVRVEDREPVTQELDKQGIGYGVYYPIPAHRQAPYLDQAWELQKTERLADEVLSIPVRPDLKPEEQERVIAALTKVTTGG